MTALQRTSHRFTALESIKIPRVMRHHLSTMLLISPSSRPLVMFLIYALWVQTATGPGTSNTAQPQMNASMDNQRHCCRGRIENGIHVFLDADGSASKQGDPFVRIADIGPQ